MNKSGKKQRFYGQTIVSERNRIKVTERQTTEITL